MPDLEIEAALHRHIERALDQNPAARGKERIGPLDPNHVRACVDCMRSGGVALFFSRATYGLATNGTSEEGVRRIYDIKGRSYGQALPMLATAATVDRWVSIPPSIEQRARWLVEAYWPGGLSLVLPKRRGADGKFTIPGFMTAGIDTVAVMCMDEVAFALADAADFPIAATSANFSGRPSITDSVDGIEQMGDLVDLLLLGPASDVGVNNTIVDLVSFPPRVLRAGPVGYAELKQILPDLQPAG